MKAKIIGTGSSVPKLKIDNKAFEDFLDTSDEWIKERTGISERHVATEETVLSLGADAAKRALLMAELDGSELEIIICTTATPDFIYPNMACLIQSELGNNTAMCYDINAACSGFLYGAMMAKAYIESGMAKTVMVVSSEITTKTLDYTDRGSCILFGDGAGAVIFGADSERGIISSVGGSDGSRGGCITLKAGEVKNHWTDDKESVEPDLMHMEGRAVYSFATRMVPEIVEQVINKANYTTEEIDWFLFHQANGRMLEVIARKLGVSLEKVPINVGSYGNTSSASLPILLDELVRAGKIKTGDRMVMSGFGAGLTWGALLLTW